MVLEYKLTPSLPGLPTCLLLFTIFLLFLNFPSFHLPSIVFQHAVAIHFIALYLYIVAITLLALVHPLIIPVLSCN